MRNTLLKPFISKKDCDLNIHLYILWFNLNNNQFVRKCKRKVENTNLMPKDKYCKFAKVAG